MNVPSQNGHHPEDQDSRHDTSQANTHTDEDSLVLLNLSPIKHHQQTRRDVDARENAEIDTSQSHNSLQQPSHNTDRHPAHNRQSSRPIVMMSPSHPRANLQQQKQQQRLQGENHIRPLVNPGHHHPTNGLQSNQSHQVKSFVDFNLFDDE